MLVTVVVLFAVSWLPVYMVRLRLHWGPDLDSGSFEFTCLVQVRLRIPVVARRIADIRQDAADETGGGVAEVCSESRSFSDNSLAPRDSTDNEHHIVIQRFRVIGWV